MDLVMVGHSERRHGFGESNEMENRKVKKALEYGFTTLLCVGETLEEKQVGVSAEILRIQLKIGLHGVGRDKVSKIWIAYEPVWSIGVNGTPASADYAEEMHNVIRECLAEIFGEEGKEIPVLYGGSVNSENGSVLISQPDIDGLFTTRTAFQIEKFVKIIKDAIKERNSL